MLTRLPDGRVGVEARIFDPAVTAVDYALVEQTIRDLAGEFDVDAVVFDPWRFGRSAELLSDEGLIMVESPMTNERTVIATDRLYKAIVDERRIVHDGDPALRDLFLNVNVDGGSDFC